MTIGHNSKRVKAGPVNADRLKSFIERIEKLNEEIKAITQDRRDVFSEAKGIGYDVKTMRKVVQMRGMDAADRAAQQDLLETYMYALGMVDRIDARLAAGESQRAIAEAEGVSKSTVQRRGPNLAARNEPPKMDHPTHDPITGEVEEVDVLGDGAGHRSEPSSPAEQSVNAGPPSAHAGLQDISQGEQSGTNSDDLAFPAHLRRVRA